jgi:hypothetical protein
MAKKKAGRKKKTAGKQKSNVKRKIAAARAPAQKVAKRKSAAAKERPFQQKKTATRAKAEVANPVAIRGRRGLGSASGGQSGDTQGLSRKENFDSESVEELAEEGQSFEAEVVGGVENAKDPDQGEVTTSEVPEDDVPPEYTDRNRI